MKTAQEIRLANFRLLLEEAGSKAELRRLTGITQPYITQIAEGVKLASGRDRSIGDKAARRLEVGMKKPVGWLDKDHSMAMMFSQLDGLEGQLVMLFRGLDEDGKNTILQQANKLHSVLHPKPSATNPFPKPLKTS